MNLEIETEVFHKRKKEIETEREKKKTLGKMVKKQLAKYEKGRQNPKIPSYQK